MFGGLEVLPTDLKDDLLHRLPVFKYSYNQVKSIRDLLKKHYLLANKDLNSTPIIVIDKFTYKQFKNEISNIVPNCFRYETSSNGLERIIALYSRIDDNNVEHDIRETFVIEPVLNGKYYIIKAYALTYDGKNNFFFRTADNMVEHFLRADQYLFKISPIDLSISPIQFTSIIYVSEE